MTFALLVSVLQSFEWIENSDVEGDEETDKVSAKTFLFQPWLSRNQASYLTNSGKGPGVEKQPPLQWTISLGLFIPVGPPSATSCVKQEVMT